MKLSFASSYAVTALSHLATENPAWLVPSHVIAQEHGIPERFILKILKTLVSASLSRWLLLRDLPAPQTR
jgi:DNA-binding IscR family transcriptional regulator